MTTATQQLERVTSHSIVMNDLRERRAMEMANERFVAALDRYFLARRLWAS